MTSLLHRLEAATEGSRELDAEIYRVVYPAAADDAYQHGRYGSPPTIGSDWHGQIAVQLASPAYTTSIDAALQLVPAGWEWLVRSRDGDCYFANVTRNFRQMSSYSGGVWRDEHTGETMPADAATPALALCIASLKARESTND